jgi:plastocyanin
MTQRKLFTLFVLMIAVLVVAFVPLPVQQPEPTERTFNIQASSYEYTPGVLTVNQGDLVTIELVSTDVVHGLYLDGYDLEISADPGQTASLSFVADRAGSYRFRCSVTCGELHPFMIGKLKVGQNSLLWRGVGLAFIAMVVGVWSLRK